MGEWTPKVRLRQLSLRLLAAGSVLAELSCGGGDIQAPATGSLEVTTTTSGPEPDADGYTISLDGTDRGTLGVSGAVTIEGITPGDRVVGLSSVAPNCQVGDNPRTVTVTAGANATVAFAITCVTLPPVTGTLRVTTVTSGVSPDPDGYTVALDDGAAQPIEAAATLTVPTVTPGEHRVTLTGLATNCRVEGANPLTVTVAAGATATAAFGVVCSELPPTAPTITLQKSIVWAHYGLCYPTTGGNRPCGPSGYLAISNTGGGTLNWTATTSATWIRRSPGYGTAPSTMKVWVDGTGLPRGDYTGWIKVWATGATNSPQTVWVIMHRN